MVATGDGRHTSTAPTGLGDAVRLLDEDGATEDLRAAARALAASGHPEDAERALRIRERLDRFRRREAELVALQETARDLIRLRDVDQALQAIVRRARQLLAADVGYLSIYDPERSDFYVRATEGAVSADFRRIRVPQDVGICGAVAHTRLPQFSSDYARDRRFTHVGAIDTGVLAEDIVALLGVPLLVDHEVIGVLFVASRTARSYTPQQIALLDSLGAHAAVGIENARLFQESTAALRRAERANEELRARTADVQAAADVHERITALLTTGGDLDDVASVVSDALHGPVEILDARLRPIASSRDRPGDDALPRTLGAVRPAWKRAAEQGRAVLVEELGAWLASIGTPDDARGVLVLHHPGPLDQPQLRTLERAAMLATLVLVSRERIATAEHRELGDLVGDLLRRPGADAERVRDAARRHGVALERPLALVVLRTSTTRHGVGLEAAREALDGRAALTALHDDDLVVIVDADAANALARRVHAAVQEESTTPVTAVVSGALATAEDLPDAHRRAVRCIRLLEGLGRSGALGEDRDLLPYAALLGDHDRDGIRDFVDRTLGPLLRHDEGRDGALSRSLLAHLDHGMRTTVAAEALHLHPNTLRQRLDKISRLLPGWDDPARRLEVHLALRVRALQRQLDDGAGGAARAAADLRRTAPPRGPTPRPTGS